VSWHYLLRLSSASATRWVLGGALLLRLALWPSIPILEIDIYRYLWDGAVVAAGENPFRYSPAQVLSAHEADPLPADLARLSERQAQSASLAEALHRIHFGELATVYPPVSQAVFGLAAALTPDSVSLYTRLLLMKGTFLLFDFFTLLLLVAMLRQVRQHTAWAVLYGWSPLVLKEFANSGHLDAIAVCFATAALHAILRGTSAGVAAKWRWCSLAWGGLALALGCGAKLYPCLLLPLLGMWLFRACSWRVAVGWSATTLLASAVLLAPMFLTAPGVVTLAASQNRIEGADAVAPQPASTQQTAGSGLNTFLTQWEMNDLIFLVVVENLRPQVVQADGTLRADPWWVVLPSGFRLQMAYALAERWEQSVHQATFLAARAITLGLFGIVALGLLVQATRRHEPRAWLQATFLTLAWFWAFAPTLNPWYWTWALPLLPFAGRRAWGGVSLVVFAYYLRFWLLYQHPQTNFWGTGYVGEDFFHFVIAPLEHALWLGMLACETCWGLGMLGNSTSNLSRESRNPEIATLE
jgi:hypothetical protein